MNGSSLTGLCGLKHSKPGRQRPDAVLQCCRWLALARNRIMESLQGGFVEIFLIKQQFVLTVLVTQNDGSHRLLRHDIACNERAFAAMYLEAGFRIFGGESIVELSD